MLRGHSLPHIKDRNHNFCSKCAKRERETGETVSKVRYLLTLKSVLQFISLVGAKFLDSPIIIMKNRFLNIWLGIAMKDQKTKNWAVVPTTSNISLFTFSFCNPGTFYEI